MRILLANDDGVDAAGLQTLRAGLIDAGARVVTVAPRENRSGMSRACTFAAPVTVTRVAGGDHPVFVCDGTPVDCVRVALLSDLAGACDVVVSGINLGANLGDDVHYSGTVAAGLEAAALGISAICISQQAPSGTLAMNDVTSGQHADYDFGTAAVIGSSLARHLRQQSRAAPLVLNVNVPANLSHPTPVLTHLGRRRQQLGQLAPHTSAGAARSYYLFGAPGGPAAHDGAAGSDFTAIAAGRVSVTPLPVAHAPAATARVVAGLVRRACAAVAADVDAAHAGAVAWQAAETSRRGQRGEQVVR
jgi:5'-nucleotidase